MGLCQFNFSAARYGLNRSAMGPVSDFGAGLAQGHTFGKTRRNGIRFEAVRFSQIGNSDTFAIHDNNFSASSIRLLIFAALPSTIFWRIAQIIINAINGVTGRTITHIRYEGLKRMKPSITNAYASPSVIRPLFEIRVVASAFHSLPNRVKRMRIFERHIFEPLSSLGTKCHVMLTE
jgi:hypothetical protein